MAQDNDRDGNRQAWEIARQFADFRLIRHLPEDCKDWNDQLVGKTAASWQQQEQSAQLWQWYAIASPDQRQLVIEMGMECHAAKNPRQLTDQELEAISTAIAQSQTSDRPPIQATEAAKQSVEQPMLFTLDVNPSAAEAAAFSPVMADPAWAEWSQPAAQETLRTTPPEPSQPSLQDLRDWYRQAKDIGRSERHLQKIEQVGKAFAAGRSLDPSDLQAIAKDQARWMQQVQEVAKHAKTILDTVGHLCNSGSLFAGKKHYTLFAQDDLLYVLASGHGVLPTGDDRKILPDSVLESRRGIILKLHQMEISRAATRVTTTDAKRFEQFATLVQNKQLQVVGYDR